MEMQKESENTDMNKVMSVSIGTVTYVSIKFVGKKMVINIEQNTKHTYENRIKCV